MTEPSLRGRATGGFAWNAFGSATRAALGFAINIFLARLLGPEPFGALAIFLTVMGLSSLIIDSGLGTGLVQRHELQEEDIDLVFGWQMLIALLLGLCLLLLSGPLSLFFHQPILVSLMPWAALSVVLTAFSQVPSALLRRNMNFRSLQTAQILSYLAGYVVVCIPLALLGVGVWSLVAAYVVQAFVNTVYVIRVSKHSLRPRLKGDAELLKFGSRVLATSLINWLSVNADTLLIGRFFGGFSLGVYNRVAFLMGTPLGILAGSIQGVLLSAVARVQSDFDKIKRVYITISELTVLISFPLFFSVGVLGETFIEGIYGDRWSHGAPIIAPMALAMSFGAVGMLPGPILTAIGRADVELRRSLINAALSIPIILTAAQISLSSVAWAVALSRLTFWLLLSISLCKTIDLRMREYFLILVKPILTSLILAFIVMLFDLLLRHWVILPSVRLLACLGIIGLAYMIIFLMLPNRLITPEAYSLMLNIGLYRKLVSRVRNA